MEKILVFKTSTDATIKRLFFDLGETDIDCLIQSGQIERYKKLYPNIHFIDIFQEGFYDLPSEVMDMILEREYSQVYITFSDIEGFNYGNVLELVEKVNFKNAFFYNCNGDKIEIPKRNIIKDTFWMLYIKWIGVIYELRSK